MSTLQDNYALQCTKLYKEGDNLKKLISLLSAIAILSSTALTVPTVKAEGNPNLEEIAISLGADTDSFSIFNYAYTNESGDLKETYDYYYQNCPNTEAVTDAGKEYNSIIRGGYCWGFAALEVLAHNDIISPSDIQPEATTLNEIEKNEMLEKYLAYYQANQLRFEIEYYERYQIDKLSQTEQVSRLLDIAEKRMTEKKYFLIGIHTKEFGHAIAGIGIVDGSWTFDDNNYDKCILTLDSNGLDENKNPKHFTEQTYIYVNSETKQCYIPYYYKEKKTSTADGMTIVTYDDDSLINYKGMLSPSENIETDLEDVNSILLKNNEKNNFKLAVTQRDGTVNSIESSTGELNALGDYPWKGKYYGKGVSFKVESNYKIKRAKKSVIEIENKRSHNIYKFMDSEFVLDTDCKDCCFEAVGRNQMEFEVTEYLNEGYYNYAPHFSWRFQGLTSGKVEMKMLDNGWLINTDSLLQTGVWTDDIEYDEAGNRISTNGNYQNYLLTTEFPVLLSFDDNNEPELLIDPDKDGIFNTPVEVGDVNCDGMIDAKDASMVLWSYSKLSGKGEYFTFADNSFLYEERADFNGDGKLTAADASAILAQYADSAAQ